MTRLANAAHSLDVRRLVHLFARRPIATVVIVASLALGIGVNTAIFTIAHSSLFDAPDYVEPHELLQLWETFTYAGGTGWGTLSVPNLMDWRRETETLESIAAYQAASFNYMAPGADNAERVRGLSVEAELLPLLGVDPQLGRTFRSDERGVVVLSDSFWRTRLGADPLVLGQTLVLNEEAHEVIGVMPPGFDFPDRRTTPIYAPIEFSEGARANRGSHMFPVVGRLAAGRTKSEAASELESIASRLAELFPESQEGRSAKVEFLRESTVERNRSVLAILAGAVGFVLLITCANVTNLLLAQAGQRKREFEIRSALGAGRGRLVRQMLLETQALTLLGAALGSLLATAIIRGFARLRIARIDVREELALDPRVFGFALLCALIATALCGVVPALRWTRGRSSNLAVRGPQHDLVRSGLVVAEIALALVVIVASGLMFRSMSELSRVDPGFETQQRIGFAVALNSERYQEPATMNAYWQRLQSELEAQPSIEAAGLVSHLPLREWGTNGTFNIVGSPTDRESTSPFAEQRAASPGYFDTMGIPVMSGVLLRANLAPDDAVEIVVNQALAQKYFPEGDAVGRHLTTSGDLNDESAWARIVGVVGNVRMAGLERDPLPTIYFSAGQWLRNSNNVVVQYRGSQETVRQELRRAMSSLDPHQPAFAIEPLGEVLNASNLRRSSTTRLLGAFAALALLLSVAGVAGVLWMSATLRREEVAVRLAIGADTSTILRSFVVDGVRQTMVGVVVGLALCLVSVRALESQLYGVSSVDARTYVAAALLLLGSALAASLLPAARAARTQPARLLRQ